MYVPYRRLTTEQDGFDVAAASLNVIKGWAYSQSVDGIAHLFLAGRAMKIDLFSIIQNGKRTISFMSQALGLMAELDLGTERLRWMGDARFVLGFLRGCAHEFYKPFECRFPDLIIPSVVAFKPCPVTLSIKVAARDKYAMAEASQSHRVATQSDSTWEDTGSSLPPLKYSRDDEEGWVTFDKPILYVYGGKGPYVGRYVVPHHSHHSRPLKGPLSVSDYIAFPVSLPNDGLIDILVQEVVSKPGDIIYQGTYKLASRRVVKSLGAWMQPPRVKSFGKTRTITTKRRRTA
jgi:sphingosine kinase